MILVLVCKMIKMGGNLVIDIFNKNNFDNFVSILDGKKKLSRLIEYILSLMSKNESCKDNIL